MARPQTIRLRESPDAAPAGAPVIDARYTEVGRKRRGLLGRIWLGLTALFWAAVIGFMIPPTIVMIQRIAAAFAG
jgi:hypothetical protein